MLWPNKFRAPALKSLPPGRSGRSCFLVFLIEFFLGKRPLVVRPHKKPNKKGQGPPTVPQPSILLEKNQLGDEKWKTFLKIKIVSAPGEPKKFFSPLIKFVMAIGCMIFKFLVKKKQAPPKFSRPLNLGKNFKIADLKKKKKNFVNVFFEIQGGNLFFTITFQRPPCFLVF